MNRQIRYTIHLLLIVILLAGLPAITRNPAILQTQITTMAYYDDWFDLETGTIIPADPMFPLDPPNPAVDFRFSYNGGTTPHATIFQNQSAGVQIAYSVENYANVDFNDIGALTFTTGSIVQPFNQVAVILTPEGNYFKLGFISESDVDHNVTFQWEQLYSVIYLPLVMMSD